MIYNVLDYGIKPNTDEILSKKVQELIDLCAKEGGGTIVFPEGSYVLSTVFLKSKVKIEIQRNATILGAPSFYDYCPEEKIDYPAYQDSSHTYYHCSMFVGIDLDDVAIFGKGTIDMRAVWDEDNVRDILHRGPKCIAFKNCTNVLFEGFSVINATDLAVYFAGCKNVKVNDLYLKVFIDGISPDNCENVEITNCRVESGDDGIVFKTSYTLNKIGYCKNIKVRNCFLKSRCTGIKFGTETNGCYFDFDIQNCTIFDTRIQAIGVESVDGAIVDNIKFKNIQMYNVNAPIFVHVGKRMRGPSGREIGKISNVTFENITAVGPYIPYNIVPWNYRSYKENDVIQYPWVFGQGAGVDFKDSDTDWQMTSNCCGLKGHELENITFKNVYFCLDGGVQKFNKDVPEDAQDYPEVYVYGKILPAKAMYFRHIKGLNIENFKVETLRPDVREDLVYEKVENLSVK